MKNLKVRAKLIVSFMVVAMLAVAVGAIGIYGMRRIENSSSYMYQAIIVPMPELSKAEQTLLTVRIHVREMIIASLLGDNSRVESEFQLIGNMLPILDEYLDAYNALINEDETRRLFEEARRVYVNDLTPVVLSLYTASQTADIAVIPAALERCIYYSGIILENFDKCFSSMVNYAQSLSLGAEELWGTLLNVIIAALAVAFISTILLSLYISQSIAKPVNVLNTELKYLSNGDLTREQITVKSSDEIGILASDFNVTLNRIRDLVGAIQYKINALTNTSFELSANMNKTSDVVEKISSDFKKIKGLEGDLQREAGESNQAVEDIKQNISALGRLLGEQSESVETSSSAIEEMTANIHSVTLTLSANSKNVSELTEASEHGKSGVQVVADKILEIARDSEGLLEINSVMNNIASQTNLLSMNAAIEAAHAGEAGKGFAVVADEIRKLAESSSEQSKTISAVLKKIKSSIDKITVSTDNVLEKFEAIDSRVKIVVEQEENIRRAMEEQGQGSKQILEAISQVNEITHLVRNEVHEMLDGSREVSKEATTLKNSTQEISEGMNEMASGADQINAAVQDVKGLSTQNQESTNHLIKEVSRFKIA